ncbi:MAG TPA: hypothetical protein VN132_14600 [Bdellovibrio sp.]|nr:hypothetical protein [Bdellovibrio sp.]
MKQIIGTILGAIFLSMTVHAQAGMLSESCKDSIADSILTTDGRQSTNCRVVVDELISENGVGKASVSCPLFIPGNPLARTPYFTQSYVFKLEQGSCRVEAIKKTDRAD